MSSNDADEADAKLMALLKRIESFGAEYDSRVKIHSEQMLNITPDTGLFLSIIVRAVHAKNVLEIGRRSDRSPRRGRSLIPPEQKTRRRNLRPYLSGC